MIRSRQTKCTADDDDDDISEFITEHERHQRIDQNALDDGLRQQVLSYYAVSKRLAIQISLRDEAKQRLKLVEAKVDSSIREDARDVSEKITEREVESRRVCNQDYKKAQYQLLTLESGVHALAALKESFLQRSYVLKDLVNLWVASYYSDSESSAATAMSTKARAADAKDKIKESKRRTRFQP